MSNSTLNDDSLNAAALQAEFEALYVPENIDPRLLALWVEREQAAIDREHKRKNPPLVPPKKCGRSLVRLFPAYIGIAIMCLTVVLGLVQGLETTVILKTACIAFLVYTIIGFVVGIVIERCVHDSVETLLRDVVNRNRKEELTEQPEVGIQE